MRTRKAALGNIPTLKSVEMPRAQHFYPLASGDQDLHHGAMPRQSFERPWSAHADSPNGHARMTYVKLDDKVVAAYATFVIVEHYEGLPCFQAGWAVPVAFRKQGRATAIVDAAIAEMKRGLARAGLPAF